MAWQSLTLYVEAAEAEAMSDALLEQGVASVCIEDADAGTDAEVPRYAEPTWETPVAWRRHRLNALLAPAMEAGAVVQRAARAAGLAMPPAYQVGSIADDDWVRRTQSQFAPVSIEGRLWIVPSWHAPPVSDAPLVRLDPGMAFGTGTHPTTQLALQFLAREIRGGEHVLDYGCGSGILAIAAAKLGAARIGAVDIDPQALQVAAENARANEVDLEVCAPDELPHGDYDVVVANILSNPLILLAPLICSLTRVRGRLALSGILETQASDVIAAYARAVTLSASARDGGWVLLEGRRR
ncbi:MAG: 50S ribosomal protein L11 methyltransferase [Candidatus Binataceae bacterium]|nr:50S ribosomal protein L11 methyltransferase [Candidatus Binataceae bacterium]